MANIQSGSPNQKPRGRGCLWGCIGILGVFLMGGLCILIGPFILSATGLIGPPADVRYSAAPDIYAGEQLQTTLDEFAIEGAEVYVIPQQGTNNQTAFILLDPDKGFDGFSDMEEESTQTDVNERIDNILSELADKNREHNLRISRVVINYLDENGETFMKMTTTMTDVEDYLAGRLTYEEFYGEFGMGFGEIITQWLEEYNE